MLDSMRGVLSSTGKQNLILMLGIVNCFVNGQSTNAKTAGRYLNRVASINCEWLFAYLKFVHKS